MSGLASTPSRRAETGHHEEIVYAFLLYGAMTTNTMLGMARGGGRAALADGLGHEDRTGNVSHYGVGFFLSIRASSVWTVTTELVLQK